MLVEHKECHSARAQVLCEVAQVHESALCEKDKISVVKLDIEIIRHFIKKARELMEGF